MAFLVAKYRLAALPIVAKPNVDCIWVVIKICSFSVWWSSPTRNRWSTLLTRWTGQNWEEGKSRFLRRNRQALEAEGDPGPGRQGGNKR